MAHFVNHCTPKFMEGKGMIDLRGDAAYSAMKANEQRLIAARASNIPSAGAGVVAAGAILSGVTGGKGAKASARQMLAGTPTSALERWWMNLQARGAELEASGEDMQYAEWSLLMDELDAFRKERELA